MRIRWVVVIARGYDEDRAAEQMGYEDAWKANNSIFKPLSSVKDTVTVSQVLPPVLFKIGRAHV